MGRWDFLHDLGVMVKVGQVQWGDVATWLASVGTLLAFAAAWIAIRLQRREFRLAQRQNRQAQASGLSAEVSTVPRETARGHQVFDVAVHNASSAPVFGCAVNLAGVRLSVGVIPAGASRKLSVTDRPDIRYVDLGFTDSDGRHWVRRWTGSLIAVPLSPGAVIFGGPQAFEVADYLDPLPRGIAKDQVLEEAVEKWARSTGLLDLRRARRNRRKGIVTQ